MRDTIFFNKYDLIKYTCVQKSLNNFSLTNIQ